MIQKILKVLQEENTKSPSENLQAQIEKIQQKISFDRKKEDVSSTNGFRYKVVHLFNDSPYNHALIQSIENTLTQESDCEHIFYCVGKDFEFMKPIQYKHKLIPLVNLQDYIFQHTVINADLVLIQFLFSFWIDFFTQVPIKGILAWMPWGGDFLGYSLTKFFDDFDISFCNSNNYALSDVSRVWSENTKMKFEVFLKRVSFLFTNDGAFQIISKESKHLVQIPYVFPQNYISNEIEEKSEIAPKNQNLENYKKILESHPNHIKIVLGNSSTPENNHFSALNSLKKIEDYTNKKFFVTLSVAYGDKGLYLSLVKLFANMLFPNRFFAFTEFLDNKHFIDFIKIQDIAYMNHTRSQGFGAIILYLLHNIQVFIKEENFSYLLLKSFETQTYKKFDNLHPLDSFETVIKNTETYHDEKKLVSKNLEILENFIHRSKNIFLSIFC